MSRISLSQVKSSFDALRRDRLAFTTTFEVRSAAFLAARLLFSQALDRFQASQKAQVSVVVPSASLAAILDQTAVSSDAAAVKPVLADFTATLSGFTQFLTAYYDKETNDQNNYQTFLSELSKRTHDDFEGDINDLADLIRRYPSLSSWNQINYYNFFADLTTNLFSFLNTVLVSYDFSDASYHDFIGVSLDLLELLLEYNLISAHKIIFDVGGFWENAIQKLMSTTEDLSEKLKHLNRLFNFIFNHVIQNRQIRFDDSNVSKLALISTVFFDYFFDVFKKAVSQKLSLDTHLPFFKMILDNACSFEFAYRPESYRETVTRSFVLKKVVDMLSVPEEREAAFLLLNAADRKFMLKGLTKLGVSLPSMLNSLSCVTTLYENRFYDHQACWDYFVHVREASIAFSWVCVQESLPENKTKLAFLSALLKGEDYQTLAQELMSGLGGLSLARYKVGDMKTKVSVIQEALEESLFKKYFKIDLEKSDRSSPTFQALMPKELIQQAAETVVLRSINPQATAVGEERLSQILIEVGLDYFKKNAVLIVFNEQGETTMFPNSMALKKHLMTLAEKNIYQDKIRERKEEVVTQCMSEVEKKYHDQFKLAYREARACAIVELAKEESFPLQRANAKVNEVLRKYPSLHSDNHRTILNAVCSDMNIEKLRVSADDLRPLLPIVTGALLMSGKGSDSSLPMACFLVSLLSGKAETDLSSDEQSVATDLSDVALQTVKEIRDRSAECLAALDNSDSKKTWMRCNATQVAYVMGRGLFQATGSYDPDMLKVCSEKYMEKLEALTNTGATTEEKAALSVQATQRAVERLCDEQIVFSV